MLSCAPDTPRRKPTALFGGIAAGLGGMYLSLALGIAMFILAGVALVGFMVVRVWRWWMHG